MSTIHSLHSRERKKKNPLSNCRYHCNTTKARGGGKGNPQEESWNNEDQKLNQLEKSRRGSLQKWNGTPPPKMSGEQECRKPLLPSGARDVTRCYCPLLDISGAAPRQHPRLLQPAQPQVGPRRLRKTRCWGGGWRSGPSNVQNLLGTSI